MLKINPADQARIDNYKLLIGSIVPRPIAFVTSIDDEGSVNAAPFSFFNIVGVSPPLIMISVQRKAGGLMKDTARNIVANAEFMVHIVDEDNVEQVNITSIDTPPHISEIDLTTLTLVPGDVIKVPRVAESKIAMECTLYQHVELGGTEEAPDADLIIGEVKLFHIQEALYNQGRIDLERLGPVSRLAGINYGTVGRVFGMERPVYNQEDKKED